MTVYTVPIIKEDRLIKIRANLKCIKDHPFNRTRQRECILGNYENKEGQSLATKEKSIFRGMVIPSLRHLGLIIGFGDTIRVSANGSLLLAQESSPLYYEIVQAVFYEIDYTRFGFLEIIEKYGIIIPLELDKIILGGRILSYTLSEKQLKERRTHWVNLLQDAHLLKNKGSEIKVNREALVRAKHNISNDPPSVFQEVLLEGYFKLRGNASVVDIPQLREEVCLALLKKNIIVTETMFDKYLNQVPFESSNYKISYGQPMGAKEKLFFYNGKYYRTMMVERRGDP